MDEACWPWAMRPFQCLGKMGDVAKEGRTVLFVSHNMTAIKSLCPTAILLNNGAIASTGQAQDVVDQYLSYAWQAKLEQTWDSINVAPGNEQIRVKHIGIVPSTASAAGDITVETSFRVTFQFWALARAMLNLSMHVKQISGDTVFAVVSPKVDVTPGLATFSCDIPGYFMNDGVYAIQMMVVRDSKSIYTLDDGVIFEIQDVTRDGNWWGKWPGAVRPRFSWEYSLDYSANSEIGRP